MISAVLFLHEKAGVFQIVAICIMIVEIYLITKKGQIDPGITPP
jgi:drug/metabolite transporter (DMT)-like permease